MCTRERMANCHMWHHHHYMDIPSEVFDIKSVHYKLMDFQLECVHLCVTFYVYTSVHVTE